MAVNEQHRQLDVAEQLEQTDRTLAYATRAVSNPIDSYRLIGELTRTVEHLQQTVRQLAAWHGQVVDGREYHGEDDRGDGTTGTLGAIEQLTVAADALDGAAGALEAAHAANGVVRWVRE